MASISKRTWTTRDGRVRYFDDTGKRRSKDFERKKDADAYAATIGASFNGMRNVNTPKKDHIAKAEAPGKTNPPAKVHLASPTADGVIKMCEALTGKTCTAEEIAEIHREFANLPK